MFDDHLEVPPTPPEPDPPPFKGWLVTIEGHCEEVDDFVELVKNTFADLWPEVVSEVGDDDQLSVTLRMVWHSNEFERWLETEASTNLKLKQTKEEQT